MVLAEITQQVLGQHDSGDFVAVLAHHREAGVTRVDDGLEHGLGGSSSSSTTMCERGTMMSRTWVSETFRTPWSMACSSVSRRLTRRHWPRNSTISDLAMPLLAYLPNKRDHHRERRFGFLLEGRSSDIGSPYLAATRAGLQDFGFEFPGNFRIHRPRDRQIPSLPAVPAPCLP